jgi:hypothetical protein
MMKNDALPAVFEHGPNVDRMMVLVHWLMVLVGWTAFFLRDSRFRASCNRAADYPESTATPTGSRSPSPASGDPVDRIRDPALSRVDEYPSDKDSTVVRVVAEQFGWNMITRARTVSSGARISPRVERESLRPIRRRVD